jgi:hypothetical protein
MTTKKIAKAESAVRTDPSSSPNSSPRDWSDEEFKRIFERALKILETAKPAEVLEKPVQLRDGRWLTAEEVVEYARGLEEYPGDH